MNENKQNQNIKNTIHTTKFMLRFVWNEQLGKIYLLLKSIMALFNAVFPLPLVVFPGLIINELSGAQRFEMIVIYVGLLITLPVVSKVIEAVLNIKIFKLNQLLDLKFDANYFHRVTSMDYETLESPDIQIMETRARSTLNGILNVVDHLSTLLSAIFGLIAVSSIIAMLNPFLIILIVCVTYLNSLYTKRVNGKLFLLGKELSKYDNVNWSFDWMLQRFEYAKEIRLFNLKTMLINMFCSHREKTIQKNVEYNKTVRIRDVFSAFTNMVQQAFLYIYVVYRVLVHGLAVGSMTIYMSAAAQFSSALQQVFNSYLNLSKISLNVQELIEFMNIPSKHKEGGEVPVFDAESVIEFKNVSFKYPGSENYALRNLNLTIHGNEKLCIVGANGSGKSTFIKLLTRLYIPEEGEILLNGINVQEYNYEQYQRLFAPVFQDFSRYYLTLEQNIALASEYSEERISEVIEQSNLTALVNKLPKD